MARMMKLAIFITGASGIIAQVVLMRELMVGFCANELTLGIILANWLICEAAGVFSAGKVIDSVKNKIRVFLLLDGFFAIVLPFSLFLARVFKTFMGIPFAQALGLYPVFWVSLVVILPVAFSHGALFSAAARLYSESGREESQALGRTYYWETIGTIFGGAAFTFLIVRYLPVFQTLIVPSSRLRALSSPAHPANRWCNRTGDNARTSHAGLRPDRHYHDIWDSV